MTINKAHWITDGDNVRFSMPIGKVDQERRIVSGFATLDNVDKQNDIVTTEASIDAFKKFRGNLREMHQPSAVGKVVSFKEDRYFDPQVKKFYSGVYVSAYVSKGAQDTWEKVLDGTLTGFSIGGNITKSDDMYDEKIDKSVRIIKEYELFELSLVDNPANQFANVISIEKGQLGGYLSKAVIDTVYWCKTDDIVRLSKESDESCPSCNGSMKNIGFVEDQEDITTVKFLVDSAKGIRTIKITKEENPMTEETMEVVDAQVADTADVVEHVEVAPEAPADAVAEAPVDAPAEVSAEAPVAEPVADSAPVADAPVVDIAAEKSVDAVVDSATQIAKSVADINDSLTNALSNLAETVKSMQANVEAITKSLETVTGEVKSVANEVSQVRGTFNEFGKRVDLVEKDTAFRKSGDLGEIVQEFPEMKTQKSLWGGRFLKTADLFN
jgi:tetrahydromethanopterin S-methyltransferase subunit B